MLHSSRQQKHQCGCCRTSGQRLTVRPGLFVTTLTRFGVHLCFGGDFYLRNKALQTVVTFIRIAPRVVLGCPRIHQSAKTAVSFSAPAPTRSSSGKTSNRIRSFNVEGDAYTSSLPFFFFYPHLLLAPVCETGRASARWCLDENVSSTFTTFSLLLQRLLLVVAGLPIAQCGGGCVSAHNCT